MTKPTHKKRRRQASTLKRFLLVALFLTATAAVALSIALERMGIPPRALGPYIERRASGHNAVIVRTGKLVNKMLMTLDRGERPTPVGLQTRIGAQVTSQSGSVTKGAEKLVASPDDAIRAMASARPGDVITFLPGVYRFQGRSIDVHQPGTEAQRITVRAERLDTVHIEFNATEGFNVSAPYWTFENLNIRGVCPDHSACEHAFHVTGNGSRFVARNNRVTDFNAHFKVNGSGDGFPDNGVIEGNTITNTSVRRTGNSVTPIDLVAASHWTIRANVISDFIKGYGNQISYGAFAKGGGSDNRFERNIVLCEYLLRGAPGQRVGLSLGSGGTGQSFCRDKRCITEQDRGVIEANLIAYCSDDGIYINRSAMSKLSHNTLVDTGGISVRFAESSADIEGNLVDGAIRSRDGGVIRAADNKETSTTELYLGLHPVRRLYMDSRMLNFRWQGAPPRRALDSLLVDLCGVARPSSPTYGAFEDFSACLLTARF